MLFLIFYSINLFFLLLIIALSISEMGIKIYVPTLFCTRSGKYYNYTYSLH